MENKGENPEKSLRIRREEETLKFWAEQGIFEKTLSLSKRRKEFVFFEGPPTANGRPGIHHMLARTFKDAIPRYKTMQGFHVRRKAGWDTHGLPVELQVEKELGLKSKKEIEDFGIEAFNKKCKESVWQYTDLWQNFTNRMGYWVDMDDPYVTYDPAYIESVWSVIKAADEKKLLYKDYKVLPWCPRCETALSSHELAQGYQDVKDISVTVKFKVKGQDNTYILAWTTTPWTLPGNVALAVGENIEYVKVKDSYISELVKEPLENGVLKTGESAEVYYILSKDIYESKKDQWIKEKVIRNTQPKIVQNFLGKELVGLEYEPLYPFLGDLLVASRKPLDATLKVYAAGFVTTTDGTGIVHTAVMYGQDDFELGTKLGLPKLHLVDEAGKFVLGTGFLEGKSVVEESTAIEILKDLAARNVLFKKEKYEHSYPFCWRCKTRLIYYARDSWYIRMSDPKIKETMIEENKKHINWEPAYIKDGRFGEWLRDIKDWAISRDRYWGTPLPVWVATGKSEARSTKSETEILTIGSYDELQKYGNGAVTKIIFVRHGEADHNVLGMSSSARDKHPLTEKGKGQAEEVAEQLAKMDIDVVFGSPILRARQTAEAYTKKTGKEIMFDDRIAEIKSGSWEEQLPTDSVVGPARAAYKTLPIEERYTTKRGGTGESWEDMDRRVQSFLDEVLEKHAGKTILVFAHQGSNESAIKLLRGLSNEEAVAKVFHSIANGSVFPIFVDTKRKKELDPHKPFIDNIVLEKDGKAYKRTPEVLDVWFDSGSMPFAQDSNAKLRGVNTEISGKNFFARMFGRLSPASYNLKPVYYPADFISEGIDQTRGWFYTLHAIATIMGAGAAYKNVICLGLILDAQGKKMSKSLGNTVDPMEMMEKYGADPLRFWMYSVNQPGESKNFDEKTVDEVVKKVFNLLENVTQFYELYKTPSDLRLAPSESPNVLDKWILALLEKMKADVTDGLESYKLMEPTRAIRDFIGELSTWYIRRSRDRFKGENREDKHFALATTQYILLELSKLMAPFTPLFAEDIYKRAGGNLESVHLEEWLKPNNEVATETLEYMKWTRELVTLGLEARAKSGVKVRQPLQKLLVARDGFAGKNHIVLEFPEYISIVKDELNIKEVVIGEDLPAGQVQLDTVITPELEIEGKRRDLIRQIQDLRKENNLNPGDVIDLVIPQDLQSVFESDPSEVKRVTSVREITFGEGFDIKKI